MGRQGGRLRCIAAAEAVTRAKAKEIADEAAQRCEIGRVEEARQAVEILKQRAMLGKKEPKTNYGRQRYDQNVTIRRRIPSGGDGHGWRQCPCGREE